MDHKSLARQAKADHTSRISARRGESPGDAASDKARIERAFSEHDKQLHGGKRTKLTGLRDGGSADGAPAASRLDRPGRARGGKSMRGKGNHVNVIVASGGGDKERPVPVPIPAAGPPPHPPMMPPGAGPMGPGGPPDGAPMGMPPGAGGPPMMPPRPGMPMRARGGATEASQTHGKDLAFQMKAGAAGGMGRMEKAKMKIPDEAAAGD